MYIKNWSTNKNLIKSSVQDSVFFKFAINLVIILLKSVQLRMTLMSRPVFFLFDTKTLYRIKFFSFHSIFMKGFSITTKTKKI